MLTRVNTASLIGTEGYNVIVEVDMHRGLPGFNIVGLADRTIKEASDRIKPAIINSDYKFPNEKVTVNLSPAGRFKEGSHFDLPISIGIIMLLRENEIPENMAFFGELSLDGKINSIKGALPLAISARTKGISKIVLPYDNVQEVSILRDIEVIPVKNLNEAVRYIEGDLEIKIEECNGYIKEEKILLDFYDVRGQESIKRAIVIAAAGNHGILMIGGPGCGKTMMAKRIPTILPDLTYEEKLELTGIYSVAGLLSKQVPIVSQRPFRAPHHSVTMSGLIGGGRRAKPGELTLAHRGVIFLDELGEFETRNIDVMRQPIEEGFIRINRNMEEIIFPSKVMVVAAANPCKCGHLWDEKRRCTCTQKQIDTHTRKLSGPFSDRIDMHVKVSPVSKDLIIENKLDLTIASSKEMREEVKRARELQNDRYRLMAYGDNGALDEKGIKKFCNFKKDAAKLLEEAYDKLNLSMRAYGKIMKIARTIADIEGNIEISETDVAEALLYRIASWE